jgi:hypothetical protein
VTAGGDRESCARRSRSWGDRPTFHVISDAEGEVQVGEPVAAAHSQRAHGGSSDDALILLRELSTPFQCIAQLILN